MSDNGLSHKVSQAVRPAIYARVSSRQQAEANTIASQREALEARVRSRLLVADGHLSVDGTVIYQMNNFSIRVGGR